MALKSLGPLAPGVANAKTALNAQRLCTGVKTTIVEDMAVVTDFSLGLAVSKAEADLYLHWASDLLAPAKDDDDGNS